MSETEQSSNPIRKTRVKTEDDIVRQILKLQKQLMKTHRVPSLFTFSSKYGQLEFRSDNVLIKFGRITAEMMPGPLLLKMMILSLFMVTKDSDLMTLTQRKKMS